MKIEVEIPESMHPFVSYFIDNGCNYINIVMGNGNLRMIKFSSGIHSFSVDENGTLHVLNDISRYEYHYASIGEFKSKNPTFDNVLQDKNEII